MRLGPECLSASDARWVWFSAGCVRAMVLMCCALVGSLGYAQGYPNKPIRLILPFPPGAPSDILGRVVGMKLAELLRQNVVPDNRTGAGGNVALATAARAVPDGYTITVTSPTIALSPSLYAKLDYDAEKDLAPVARVATIENVLVVNPSVPAKTLSQFISLARAQPGKFNYGSGGPGTTNHLANELLKYVEKIDIVHVPYKGATLATMALIGGEVHEVIVSVASGLPLIQSGKVRALAVLSERRVAQLPDVPTAKEAGVENFTMSIWYGIFAPVATPRPILAHLTNVTLMALETPDLRERMAGLGIDPWPGSPAELGALLRSETTRFATIVRAAGLPRE